MSVNSPRLAVSTAYSAANYLPATLKTNKSGWIIEYYVENPQTQILAKGRKTEVMSNRTYNNYAKTGSAFFTWMIDKCYCKQGVWHVVSNCERRPREPKIRMAQRV